MGDGAFAGVRVVELAQWVFVPVAGRAARRLGRRRGARRPPEGDPYRGLATQGIGTDSGGVNLSVALANRGKRSMAIDVADRGGQRVLHKLLETADVFLTSLRPDALRRLGLDADELRERYPALVYARGQRLRRARSRCRHGRLRRVGVFRPRRRRPRAHPARARLPDRPARRDGRPQRRHGARVRHRRRAAEAQRTGRGSVVDVSLLATAMWTLSSDLLSALQGPAAARAVGRGADRQPARRHVPHAATAATSSWCSWSPTDTGRPFCAVDRPRRPARRSAVRRPPRPRRGTADECVAVLDASLRGADVRGVEANSWRPRRAVGAGAGGRGAARRPAGDRQRLHRRGRRGRRRRPTACRPCRCSSTSNRRTCAARRSTASTPRRCCSSSATTGRTSIALQAKPASIP